MNIKDRSDGGASVIHAFGHSHLSTSDARAHSDQSDLGAAVSMDNQPSQMPRILPNHDSPEVAIVGSNIEPCTASHADKGGEQHDGLTAMSPVVAKLEGGHVVKVGLSSNYGTAQEQLSHAHQKSTVTQQDHLDVHQHGLELNTKKCDVTKSSPSVSIGHPVRAKSGVPPFARPVFKSTEPVITGNPPTPGETGAANPVVARVMQPRSSEAKGGYVVKEG